MSVARLGRQTESKRAYIRSRDRVEIPLPCRPSAPPSTTVHFHPTFDEAISLYENSLSLRTTHPSQAIPCPTPTRRISYRDGMEEGCRDLRYDPEPKDLHRGVGGLPAEESGAKFLTSASRRLITQRTKRQDRMQFVSPSALWRSPAGSVPNVFTIRRGRINTRRPSS